MAPNKYQSPVELGYAFMATLEDLVRELVSQNNIACYRIESSLEPSAATGNGSYTPVIRIITYFENSIEPIVAVLNNEFDVEMEQSGDAQRIAIDSFASKKLAYDVALRANRQELAEYKKYGSKHFKVRVCSMLQDAWAGIEKELGYDNGTLPEEVRRDFYRVGALLEMADLEFLKIRNKIQRDGVQQSAPVITAPVREEEPQYVAPPVVEEPAPVVKDQSNFVFASKPIAAEPAPYEAPAQQEERVFSMPAAETRPDPAKFNDTGSRINVTPNGIVEKGSYSFRGHQPTKGAFEEKQKGSGPIFQDENAPMTEATLREYVLNSKLLAETDAQIALNAGARLNNDIDIEGDIERLRFLKVMSLKQLHEKIAENKKEIIAFAEKWIGKDNGGTFDKGISLFYLEYLIVGKKNDPALAVEYVLKFISDNEYSARYIIPTYDSIIESDANVGAKFAHLTLK